MTIAYKKDALTHYSSRSELICLSFTIAVPVREFIYFIPSFKVFRMKCCFTQWGNTSTRGHISALVMIFYIPKLLVKNVNAHMR